ncbi:MAG: hypothetical protein M1459_02450 [Patescibacteria group bacterium]|nr:hypothetical protein [Patescibacteria group bacterium]
MDNQTKKSILRYAEIAFRRARGVATNEEVEEANELRVKLKMSHDEIMSLAALIALP